MFPPRGFVWCLLIIGMGLWAGRGWGEYLRGILLLPLMMPSTPDLSLTYHWSPGQGSACLVSPLQHWHPPPSTLWGLLPPLKDENTKFSLWWDGQVCRAAQAQIRVWSRSMVSNSAPRTLDFDFPGRGLHSRVFDLLARRLFGFSILYWILVVFYPLSLFK